MAKIKSYSDLQQSKKLAEILPLSSADMVLLHEEPYETSDSKFDGLHQALCVPFNKYDKSWRQKYKNISYFPCWSLANLLDVLPKDEGVDCSISFGYYNGKGEYIEKWLCAFEKEGETTDGFIIETIDGDNPVDACVAMIEKLHELKML